MKEVLKREWEVYFMEGSVNEVLLYLVESFRKIYFGNEMIMFGFGFL